ncbi:sensor histidine kinase [Nannocystis pusilla]|uniref:sensor histidine kinase n=1 Tax=Nannocystis pusilla TaxID=889268 RepID=UPI003BF11C19
MSKRATSRRSIAGRLTIGTVVLVIVALIVGGVAITLALHRFVRAQVDQRLDLQLVAVAAALQPGADGRLELRGRVDAPPFDHRGSGWSWRADSPGQTFSSSSLAGSSFTPAHHGPHPGPPHDADHPRPGPPGTLEEVEVVSRTLTTELSGLPVTITATAPLRALRDPLREVLTPVALMLIGLGLLLGVGSVVLLRLGLRPLAAVRRDVEEVRHGRLERLPDEQPLELMPLVDELNALLDENAEGLRRARGHVANLGHALKTPLTSLALTLEHEPADAERRGLVAEMDRCIRHHLGRARAGSVGAPARVSTAVRPRLDDLVAALAKIYAARGLVVTVEVDAAVAVACEPQDLDEMLGNLLDNACKWTSGRIRVGAHAVGRAVEFAVEDDGAGLPSERVPEALLPGRRLDESVPGDGFGLSICRELAELYGGELRLERSALGGLAARLVLPSAAPTR